MTETPAFAIALVFLLTTQCNLECVYCNVEAGPHGVRPVLDPRLVEQWLTAFASLEPSAISVQLHGGEPLIVDPPVELYGAIVRNSMARFRATKLVGVSIQSNGLTLDEKRAVRLQRSGIRIDISLDGPASIHDRQRTTTSGRGSHRQAFEALQLLRSRGNDTGVIAVVTDPNDVAPALDFFLDNRIPEVRMNPIRPAGRGVWFKSWSDSSFMTEMANAYFRAAIRIAEHNERFPESRLFEDNMSRMMESLAHGDAERPSLSWTFLIDDHGDLWAHPGSLGTNSMRLSSGELPGQDVLRRILGLPSVAHSSVTQVANDLRSLQDRLFSPCPQCRTPDFCVPYSGPRAGDAISPLCIWRTELLNHFTRWLEDDPDAARRITRRAGITENFCEVVG